jgi:ABC-type lipoprotein release transport system permease subunit
MKFIIQFAFKNIWRYKKRTIITFIAISVGIAGFIYMDSMLKGLFQASVQNFIDYESSHLKIYNREFYKEMTDEGFLLLDKGIENYENVEKIIESKELKTTPRISFSARLVNEKAGGERPFTVVGIDPENDKNVYKLNQTLISGKFLEKGIYGIIIGNTGAKKMGVDMGDALTIFTRTKYDTYQAIMVEVVGIFATPNPNINKSYAYIPIDIANSDLSMEGSVTEIDIRAKNDNVETQVGMINDVLQKNGMTQLEVIPWTELGKDWLTLNRTKMAGSYIMILLVFIISAVGIINTMLMSVFERMKEIGMMRALGMRDSEVLLSFVFEGAAIGLFGAIFGSILGVGLNIHLIYHGISLEAYSNMDIGYRVADVMKGVWNIGSMIFAFIFSIIAPALISIYPSRKAIKMEITKSLKAT